MGSTARIGSYNIHCVPPFQCSVNYLDQVAAYVVTLVRNQSLDVLVINEAFRSKVPSILLRHLRTHCGDWASTPYSSGGLLPGSGVLVMWNRNTVQRDGRIMETTFKKCCQTDCLAQKGGTGVSFVKNGRAFAVVATHLQAYEIPGLCDGVRNTQIEALRRLRDRFSPNMRGIYVGDMNQAPDSSMYKVLGAEKVPCIGPATTFEDEEYDYAMMFPRLSHGSSMSVVHDANNLSDHYPIVVILAI